VDSQAIHANLSPPTFRNGRRLILSVDDEPVILFTREKILEREGYAVISATGGGEALKAFSRQAIDLVLLDYAMPGMDGGIVAREMKRRKPLVPIIMVSANHVPQEALTCADCFVAKGQGPALLLEQIRQLLEPLSDPRRCGGCPLTKGDPETSSREQRIMGRDPVFQEVLTKFTH
jgi:CheY-like chemotaxis protein